MLLLSNLKIRTKLIGAFSLIVILLSGLGVFAITQLSHVNETCRVLATDWMPSIETVSHMNDTLNNFRINEGLLILANNETERAQDEVVLNRDEENLKKEDEVFQNMLSSEEERLLNKEFMRQWDEYIAIDKEVRELVKKGQHEQALQIFRDKSNQVFNNASATLKRLTELNKKGGNDAAVAGQILYTFAHNLIIGVILVAVVLALFLAILIIRNVATPITTMTAAMVKLGQGDKTVEVPGVGRQDEIGGMASALQVFKETAIEAERMQNLQQEGTRKQIERGENLAKAVKEFEMTVARIVNTVASAATEMQATSETLSSAATETNTQATAVAAAAEQASSNVQTVASSAEELTASIGEINNRVGEASKQANDATSQATRTSTTMQALNDMAQKIGSVVELVQEIAAQTNLLALNATIEAARAGEAGKGFAVVASEVKGLANQTAKATEEISGQISTIQSATGQARNDIEVIAKTIAGINSYISGIASAAEEQRAATQEISRSVNEAAKGTQEVTSNVVNITHASSETGRMASETLTAASELSKQAELLKKEVSAFISRVQSI